MDCGEDVRERSMDREDSVIERLSRTSHGKSVLQVRQREEVLYLETDSSLQLSVFIE